MRRLRRLRTVDRAGLESLGVLELYPSFRARTLELLK
jgi:hypothetical protein